MSAPRFLLVGAASEFSLRPLGVELARRGLPVSLVDLAERPADAASTPVGDGPLVLVTSQHLAMTGDVYDAYSDLTTHVVSPAALRVALGADLLVYVPHDLVDPVLPAETPLLQLLDLFVATDEASWWVRAHVPTVVAGWAGALGTPGLEVPPEVGRRGVLFVSATRWIHANGGGPALVAALSRTLDHGLVAKLPDWPGVEDIEEALRNRGVQVLDRRTPARALIAAAPLVVSTASGSVLAEAVLAGHRPVCVVPTGGADALTSGLSTMDIEVCDDAGFPSAAARAGRVGPDRAVFDVDGFLTAVRELLDRR